ncbi:heterokaryon incompatibility protein-domain-containing protein [Scleroderma yunnanense]
MRLINVNAFIKREQVMSKGERVDRRVKVLQFGDDEATRYAILSHRWTEQEVDYDEMIELTKMDEEDRGEIRRRFGYKKILDSCEQAEKDGYEWLWIDTCCIDKRSSAELSEAINSMYRWYQNSRVCYVYLHDVDSSFPTEDNKTMYPNSNGWPEWFARGWTLQEMIAPSIVRFFDKDWHSIGDKKTLASTLEAITRVPQHILINGLASNRPCVAQIMSWAANRRTTRVEDIAYSLLGLLDVNMPMLYGEGKKAFHRLQLEIIRISNDQSIFAWGSKGGNQRASSILADNPSLFRDCNEMELIDLDEFIPSLKEYIPEDELRSVNEDRFGVFPITNRGIQIWLLICPLDDSRLVFKARLPCRFGPSGPPVTITLNLWKSNCYRYSRSLEDSFPSMQNLQFRQLYLSCQDVLHRDTTFEIDDSAIVQNSLIYCGMYPWESKGNTLKLTDNKFLCVRVYADNQANCRFAVAFGHCGGQDWIHLIYEEHASTTQHSWKDYAKQEYNKMRVSGPEHAKSMAKARSRGSRHCVRVMQTHLPRSGWTVRTSCVEWDGSMICGVRIDAFQNPGFSSISNEWRCIEVDRTNDPNRDMRGLKVCYNANERQQYKASVDQVFVKFLPAPNGIKAKQLGDYGDFTGSEGFCREGNIFDDLKSLAPELDITPKQHKIGKIYLLRGKEGTRSIFRRLISPFRHLTLYKPLGLSLPSNHHFTSLLASLSTQFANKYLISRIIQCPTAPPGEPPMQSSISTHSDQFPRLDVTIPLCTIEKPLVWHQD